MDKGSKYDTDPLDPDFARRTDEIFGATEHLGHTPEAERQRSPAFERAHDFFAEEPTRRFDDPSLTTSYPSVFVPPASHQPPAAAAAPPSVHPSVYAPPPTGAGNRRVAKLGITENVASGLAYAPFFIGMIVSLIELLLLPRGEVRTRFHAAQALSVHFMILAVGLALNFARFFVNLVGGGFSSSMLGLISGLFSLAALIFLIVLTVRVWKGEDTRVPQVADLTKWINQHLDPVK